jgi:hypothetical protein
MVIIVGLISAVLYFTRKLISQEKILFMFILISTILSSVWLIDNVLAIKINLLTEKEDDAILSTMKTIIEFTLGFYFGSKATNKE